MSLAELKGAYGGRRMIEIDGKKYKLQEAYAIHDDEVERCYAGEWDEKDFYQVDVAQRNIGVMKCFVLVEEATQ